MKATIGINFEQFDPTYRPMVLMAILRMEDVLSSPIFYNCLAEEIMRSNNLEGELSKWKKASLEEIYNQLFPITLYLNTYYSIRNVIGYGLPGTKNIYLNTKFLAGYSINNTIDLMYIGSNLLHEHSHDCGFDHDFKPTARRENSLSYILNRAYERAYRKYYKLPELILKLHTPWYKRLWRKVWN